MGSRVQLALAVALAAGCSFSAGDDGGAGFRCGAGDSCPPGFRCEEGACISHDAAVPDAVPPDSAVTSDCPDNLLANPSFETGTSGWGGVGGPLTQVDVAHDGAHAAQKCFDGSDTYFNVNDNPDSVTETRVGARYAASAWLRADTATDQTVRAVIRVKDAIDTPLEQTNTAIILKPDWLQVTVEHVVEDPAGTAVEIYFSNSAPVTGDCFQLDHVCFRPVP
ncbi:MAG TPA: carbohydrate binding domain-containing protein [Kofleriaceae bacterium]|nr:carbohydrate binding domain-containing protein [Kofleriaceae bacterium]